MNARMAIGLVVGVVLGFVLGGIGPRSETAALRTELDEIREQLIAAQKRTRQRGMSPVPLLDRALRPRPPARPAAEPDEDDGDLPEGGGPELVVVPDAETEAGAAPDPLEQFDLAAEAQHLRAEQSRRALAEQAELDDEELETFDGIVNRMNDRLAEHAGDLIWMAQSGEAPETREMLRLSHEVTGVLYDTQVALEEVIGDESLDDVDPQASTVWNHVDLEVFREAVEDATGEEGP